MTRLLREEVNIYWLQLIWITIKHERIQLLFWHWPVSKWICLTRSFRFLRRHTTNISVGTIQRQKIDSLTQPLYTVQQSTPNDGRASVFHTDLPQKQSDTGISCCRVRYYVPTTMWTVDPYTKKLFWIYWMIVLWSGWKWRVEADVCTTFLSPVLTFWVTYWRQRCFRFIVGFFRVLS